MAVRLLKPESSLLVLIIELRYTLSRAQADPRAAFLVPVFQPLRDECDTVLAQELALQEALSKAQAQIDIADENLDGFASRLSKAVLVITQDDRSHPLYLHFFNKKALSTFTRPKLGTQLEAQRAWVDDLGKSPQPTLQAMTAELVDLIDAADQALAARTDAATQNRSFRDVGARRQLFDKVNAARKAADGDLAKVAIQTPGLSTDYPTRFFRATPVEDAVADPSIESVTQEIADLTGKLDAANKLLADLQAAAAKAKEEEANRQADEAALAAIQEAKVKLAKQEAELLGKLGKK